MKNKLPLQKFHVKLLKSTVKRFNEILEDDADVSEYVLRSGLGFTGKLFISPPSQTPPSWLTFVQSGIKEPLQELNNRTNAAALVIRRKGRMFAFTFGHGRNLLRSSTLVPDFGLRTALNGLQHTSLRSLDSFTVEEQTVHTRTQASRAGGIEVFGLDIGKDILRAVTGNPRIDVPLNSISGTESTLAISTHVDFPGLGQLCDDLLTLYQKRTYKENFGWVDNVRKVHDPLILEKLHNKLLDQLKQGGNGLVVLSPPEPVEWGSIRGFSYTRRKKIIDHELQIKNYLKKTEIDELSIDNMKQDKVFVFKDDDVEPTDKWSVYKCLSFETTLDGKDYILTTADWFEINSVFAKRIDRTLESIPVSRIDLPALVIKGGKLESEGSYNTRVANDNPSIALLDKQLARCRFTSSGIEPCDLFTPNFEFVHVKHKKGGSSDLSHLFAQGRISADALIGDEDFRKNVRIILSKIKPALQEAIPETKPAASKYEIVFALLGTEGHHPGKELPFFSKLNLARTFESLTSLGFRMSVIGVQIGK